MNATRLRAIRPLLFGLVGIVVLVLALGRCSTLPSMRLLPGPKAVSGTTYDLNADFDDVLNLPIGARVKLNGATIGRVERIATKDYVARLALSIGDAHRLPIGTTAQIRFSTPLGELYVAVTPPAKTASNMLAPGDLIPTSSTGTAPTIEDTFAALSILLNNGSLDQINVLVREAAKVLHGNTGPIRALLDAIEQVVTDLNSRKGSLDTALVSMRTLSRQLVRGDAVINEALEAFPEAIGVLSQQTRQMSALMRSLDRLGRVTTSVVRRGGSAIVSDVRSTATVLESLARVRSQLRPTLDQLIRLGEVVAGSSRGDYLNAEAAVVLDFENKAVLPSSTGRSAPEARSLERLFQAGLG